MGLAVRGDHNRYSWIALTAVGFVAIALAAAGGSVHPVTEGERRSGRGSSSAVDPPPPIPRARPRDEPPTPAEPSAFIDLLVDVAVVLVAIAGVVVLVVVIRRLLATLRARDRPPPAVASGPAPDLDAVASEIGDAVDTAQRQLADGRVDDAVIACWLRFEQAAASAGLDGRPGDTATSLAVSVLAAFDVPRSATDQLLALYHLARYSTHRLGEADRRSAQEALAAIQAQLVRTPA